MVLHRAVVVKSEHGCPFLDATKMVAEAEAAPADAAAGTNDREEVQGTDTDDPSVPVEK